MSFTAADALRHQIKHPKPTIRPSGSHQKRTETALERAGVVKSTNPQTDKFRKFMERPHIESVVGIPACRLFLTIKGQVRGGKNNMGTTKAGHHYAKKPFKTWRDDAIAQVKSQLLPHWTPIDCPATVRLDYTAGDKRRRDMPAIIDALWHVLEKSGVVTDDTFLWITNSVRKYDKKSPGVSMLIET